MTRPENFTARQRAEIFRRAGGHCEKCSRKLGIGGEKWEAHHKTGVWEGGRADVENGQALCVQCHSTVTAAQAGQRSEARRWERKRAGIKRASKWKRTFATNRDGRFKAKLDGTIERRD